MTQLAESADVGGVVSVSVDWAARGREQRAIETVSGLPGYARVLKRSLDIVVGTIGLLLALPVLVLASVAICVETRGGPLFVQQRIGRNGKPFRMVKLRTMVRANDDSSYTEYVVRLMSGEAQASHGLYKLTDDPRVTRVGRVLRKLSIDELTQLWNVVRGNMSLVGPRPDLPAHVAIYDDTTLLRLRVKPGMTGSWQVSGRSSLDFAQMVALDVGYWQDWTIHRELAILARTPIAVLRGRGAA
jgi:lipopolysaccharide/colanic/teichoic acid biosynthesis glycosyltransferase